MAHALRMALACLAMASLMLAVLALPASAQDAATPVAPTETAASSDNPPSIGASAESSPEPADLPTLHCDGAAASDLSPGGKIVLRCSITIDDRGTYQVVARSTSPEWTLRFEDTASPDPLAIAGDDGPLPQSRGIALDIVAPRISGSSSTITLAVEALDGQQVPDASFATTLTATVPGNWSLTCALIGPPVVPGSTGEVSCTIPDDAWSARGAHPTARSDVTGDQSIAISSQSFTVPASIPCAIPPDTREVPATIVAALADGIELSGVADIPIEEAATPTLEVGDISVDAAVWHGGSYLPATLEVELTVRGASTPCGGVPWTLRVTGLSLTREGEPYRPESIENSGTASSGTVSPITIRDHTTPQTVATGQGDGTVHLSIAIVLPPDTPAGAYDGLLGLTLAPDP